MPFCFVVCSGFPDVVYTTPDLDVPLMHSSTLRSSFFVLCMILFIPIPCGGKTEARDIRTESCYLLEWYQQLLNKRLITRYYVLQPRDGLLHHVSTVLACFGRITFPQSIA